jgi:hypothetical protein
VSVHVLVDEREMDGVAQERLSDLAIAEDDRILAEIPVAQEVADRGRAEARIEVQDRSDLEKQRPLARVDDAVPPG